MSQVVTPICRNYYRGLLALPQHSHLGGAPSPAPNASGFCQFEISSCVCNSSSLTYMDPWFHDGSSTTNVPIEVITKVKMMSQWKENGLRFLKVLGSLLLRWPVALFVDNRITHGMYVRALQSLE